MKTHKDHEIEEKKYAEGNNIRIVHRCVDCNEIVSDITFAKEVISEENPEKMTPPEKFVVANKDESTFRVRCVVPLLYTGLVIIAGMVLGFVLNSNFIVICTAAVGGIASFIITNSYEKLLFGE